MRAPLGSSLGRHLLAAVVALGGICALQGRAQAASCIPGFDFAGFGVDSVRFGGGATSNSYDSTGGPYPSGVLPTGGDIGTNGDCAVVNTSGAGTIGGNVVVGEGNSCSGTVSQATGSEPVFPAVTIPASTGVARGACTNCTMDTLTGNTWTTVGTTNPSGVTTLAGGTFVVTGNFGTTTLGTINVTAASVVYLTCASGSIIDIKGTIQTVGNKPGNLVILAGPSCTTISINGGANPAFALYAPNAAVTLNGAGEVYGSIVAKDLKVTGSAKIHYDRALRNLEVGTLICAAVEISRATPIIATIGGTELLVQGTYESPIPSTRSQVNTAADLATFVFPDVRGHLRARPTSGFDTSVKDFNIAALSLWDGATGLPPVSAAGCASNFTTACRTVFTNADTPFNPANLVFNTGASAASLGPRLDSASNLDPAQEKTLITKILGGGPGNVARLGGLDRSTVAIIPSSLVAGTSRPTIVYVGGTDGMLHAFCAEDFTPPSAAQTCARGKELWAFVPRTLLGDLRLNAAIIDGSPRVVDMFGNFDGTGAKFRTILTFTTGSGARTTGNTPAVYALDITDPTQPKVVWEYTWNPSTSVRGYELGRGQTLAQTVISIGGVKKNVVYAQTTNGQSMRDGSSVAGSGLAGTVITALNVDTGTELFEPVGYPYPNPPRVDATANVVPSTGVPGGAVSLELTGAGFSDALVFGTLYGEIWVADPSTGLSKYSVNPLFRFTQNGKPVGAVPAIYKDAGFTYAVGVTGGYWDRQGSSDWGTSATQHGFVVRLGLPSTAAVPFTELDAGSTNVPFVKSFGGGQKLSAQALVVGNEVFFTSETSGINSSSYATTATATGAVASFNLTNGAAVNSEAILVAGVGSLAKSSSGQLFASGARGTERLNNGGVVAGGQSVSGGTPKLTRRLWLRTL